MADNSNQPKPSGEAPPPAGAAKPGKSGPTPQDEYVQQLLIHLALNQPELVAKIINQWLSEDKKTNG